MNVALLAYPGMTALDAVGPAQVLAAMPGARVTWVAAEPGSQKTDCGMAIVASASLMDLPRPDVVLVPGALDVRPVLKDERVLAWLRAAHETTQWTTSVCTGALILGAAGLLTGTRATTHWLMLDRLRAFGAEPVAERVVQDGKIITGAGVSAGIDMALRLVQIVAGDAAAQVVQLAIEYDPAPPFVGGSPRTAPTAIVDAARKALSGAA
jgi:transcriptional regulator GlxA family with amidase domain